MTRGWAFAVVAVVSGAALAGDGLMPEIRTIKGTHRGFAVPENVVRQSIPVPQILSQPQPVPQPEAVLPVGPDAASKLLQDAKQNFSSGNMDAALLLAESARDLAPDSSVVRDNAVQLVELIHLKRRNSKRPPMEFSEWSSGDRAGKSETVVQPVGLRSSAWNQAEMDRGAASALEAATSTATRTVVNVKGTHDHQNFVEGPAAQDGTPAVTEPLEAVTSERTLFAGVIPPIADAAPSTNENSGSSKSSLTQPDVMFWSGMTGAMLGSISVLAAGLFVLSQKARGGVVKVQIDGSSEMIALVNSIRGDWKEGPSAAARRETGTVVDLSAVPLRLHQTFDDKRIKMEELEKKRTQEICQIVFQQNVKLQKQMALP